MTRRHMPLGSWALSTFPLHLPTCSGHYVKHLPPSAVMAAAAPDSKSKIKAGRTGRVAWKSTFPFYQESNCFSRNSPRRLPHPTFHWPESGPTGFPLLLRPVTSSSRTEGTVTTISEWFQEKGRWPQNRKWSEMKSVPRYNYLNHEKSEKRRYAQKLS